MDVAAGAVSIFRRALDEQRDDARGVSFVRHLLERRAIELAGATLDGARDGGAWHLDGPCVLQSLAQVGVGRRVAACAQLRCDRDLAGAFRPRLAASRIRHAILVLEVCPVGMAAYVEQPPFENRLM